MIDLQVALKAYRDAKKIVDTPVEGDWRSIAGRLSLQSRTRDELPSLRENVALLIGSKVSVVVPEGVGTEKFCSLAAKKGYLVVDGEELYRRIADYVWQTMNPKGFNQFGVAHFSMLLDEIGSMMSEMGLKRSESPKWTTPVIVADYEALVLYVKQLIHQAPGIQFVSQYLIHTIVKYGLDGQYNIDRQPVVVKNLTPEITHLTFTSSKTIQTTGRIGVDFVLEALGATPTENKSEA